MSEIEKRLQEYGIVIQRKDRRGQGMVATRRHEDLLFVSGHGPVDYEGKVVFTGKLGIELSEEEGYKAARLCGINMLASVKDAIGDLDRVACVVKVFGLVASGPDFYNQPKVMNGFSDLMVEVFGERGQHARSAMGTCCLPQNIPVEVEAIFRIRD